MFVAITEEARLAAHLLGRPAIALLSPDGLPVAVLEDVKVTGCGDRLAVLVGSARRWRAGDPRAGASIYMTATKARDVEHGLGLL